MWGAIIGSVVGGLLASRATSKASNAQEQASSAAIAEQARQYDQTREDFEPWRTTGRRALRELYGDINQPVTAEDALQEPGYQFGLDEGQKAIDRRIAAMGGRVSGAAIKEAARYGGDYATTRYQGAYQRREDRRNRLAALAGIGQTATGQTAVAGANSANSISGILQSQGDATAAARLAQGSIWGNAGNRIAALYSPNKSAGATMWDPTYDDTGAQWGGWTGQR